MQCHEKRPKKETSNLAESFKEIHFRDESTFGMNVYLWWCFFIHMQNTKLEVDVTQNTHDRT